MIVAWENPEVPVCQKRPFRVESANAALIPEEYAAILRLNLDVRRRYPSSVNEVASNLIGEIRPECEADAVALRVEYPSYHFSLTQDSNLTLSCYFPQAPPDAPDEVALVVQFFSSGGTQRVMTDITWGHPSGHIEDSIPHEWSSSDDWPVLTPEIAATIFADMPRLRESFRRAVARGFPS